MSGRGRVGVVSIDASGVEAVLLAYIGVVGRRFTQGDGR